MKIALLLTGLTRTCKQTYESVLQKFPPDKVDVFLETWDVVGHVPGGRGGRKPGRYTKEPSSKEKLYRLYNPVYCHIESIIEWEKQYKKLPPEQQKFSAAVQFYKIHQGMQNISSDYDIVIKNRFDISLDGDKDVGPLSKYQFTGETLLETIIKNKDKFCYLGKGFTNIKNACVASSYENMLIYADYYYHYYLPEHQIPFMKSIAKYIKSKNIELCPIIYPHTLVRRYPQVSKVYFGKTGKYKLTKMLQQTLKNKPTKQRLINQNKK